MRYIRLAVIPNVSLHDAGCLSIRSRRFRPLTSLCVRELNYASKVVPVLPRAFEERLHIPVAEGEELIFLLRQLSSCT